jgi:hypothetical protein
LALFLAQGCIASKILPWQCEFGCISESNTNAVCHSNADVDSDCYRNPHSFTNAITRPYPKELWLRLRQRVANANTAAANANGDAKSGPV